MFDFKMMRDRVVKWQKDLSLEEMTDSRKFKNHEMWMAALQENAILFNDGMGTKVHYKSFREIDFTGPEINNQEWRAQLNRFFCLPHLAFEYFHTKDERWAKMARDYIENWIDFRPNVKTDTLQYAWEQCGDNCLSLSARLGQYDLSGWFGSLPYFEGSAYFDDAFIDRMIASAKDQMVFLMNWLSKHGNFRISQAHTMLFLAQTMPEHFAEYRDMAVAILNEAFRIQVNEDGSHGEQTIGYHTWMQRVFTEFALYGKRYPELGFDIPAEKLIKMYDYELANYTPDGRHFGINDSGRWHPDAVGADVGARIEYTNKLRAFLGAAPCDTIPSAFPDAGQYFFRHGNDALVLDATKYRTNHTHMVRGALLFYHGDRLILCDPGSINYERSDPLYQHGKSSAMHNTVTVNNWYQSRTENTAVPVCIDTDELSFAICRYTGGYVSCNHLFSREDQQKMESCAGTHARAVLWLKGKFAVVLDLIDAMLPEYDFAAHWQFLNEEVCLTENGMHTVADGANLLITSPWCNREIKAVKYFGDMEKKIGFIARAQSGVSGGAPAPMLSVEGKGQGIIGPVRLLTVLAPFEGGDVPQVEAVCTEDTGSLYLDVTVNGETWNMAVDTALLQGDFIAASVGRVGDVPTYARAAVKLPDGTIRSL